MAVYDLESGGAQRNFHICKKVTTAVGAKRNAIFKIPDGQRADGDIGRTRGDDQTAGPGIFGRAVIADADDFGADQVGNWTVRISDEGRADEISREIDALFENSPDPTRTTTEDESNRQFARQLGDMGFITTMIMSAVFFTIILLTGMAMASRWMWSSSKE